MRRKKQKNRKTNVYAQKKIHVTQVVIIALAIVSALFVWFFGFRPFLVHGMSMYPSFNTSFVDTQKTSIIKGDYLIIDAFSYRFLEDPKRLDVVVAKGPAEPGKYILKRIIGLPNEQIHLTGNTVAITDIDGNTVALDEELYINKEDPASYKSQTIHLNNNQYYLLGDNRTNSLDSRVWGALTKEKIIGRVVLRLYPFNKIEVTPGNIDKSGEDVL